MSGNGSDNVVPAEVAALRGQMDRVAAEIEAEDAGWGEPILFDDLDLPAFPTECLPPWMQLFVEAEAMATQTPRDLAAMLSLAVCATALQGKFRIHVTGRWVEPVNLYVVVVLEPASRKSAVYSHVTKPLEDWEDQERKRLLPEVTRLRARRRVIEIALKSAEKKAAKTVLRSEELAVEVESLSRELQEFQVPALPELILDDVTPEKLAQVMAEQNGRVAIMSAEGGGPFGMMRGRYAKNGQPNFEAYLKAHSGDRLRVHRVGRDSDYIENPTMSMGLTVQPDVIRSLSAEPSFRQRGLLGRILYAIPKSTVGRRRKDAPQIPEEIIEDYHQGVQQLLGLADEQTILEMEPEAERTLLDYQAEIEPQLGPGQELHDLQDWAGKLGGVCARLSAIIEIGNAIWTPKPHGQNGQYGQKGNFGHFNHIVPNTLKTTTRSVLYSIAICRYLCSHAKAAYSGLGRSRNDQLAEYVCERFKAQGWSRASKREIYRVCRGTISKVDELEAAIDVLLHREILRQSQPPKSTVAGRPRGPHYELHPYLLEDRWSKWPKLDKQAESKEKTATDRHGQKGITDGQNAPIDDCPV